MAHQFKKLKYLIAFRIMNNVRLTLNKKLNLNTNIYDKPGEYKLNCGKCEIPHKVERLVIRTIPRRHFRSLITNTDTK